MAKIRLPKKVEPKPSLLLLDHIIENRLPCAVSSKLPEMSSSLGSSGSHSCTSSSESNSAKSTEDSDRSWDELDDIISGVNNIKIFKTSNPEPNESQHEEKFVYKQNIFECTDQKSDKSSDNSEEDDEDEYDEGLIERGPVRPQLHNRSKPYVDSSHHWQGSAEPPPNENSTDYDTSAKEIMTDLEYREKIDQCLNQLSDLGQEQSVANSLSPRDSDFGGASSYSQPPSWQADQSPASVRSNSSSTASCFVPSITVCDSESSLLEILSKGGFQAAQSTKSPDYNSGASVACVSDHWPDSPASSYNNCATSISRPESRASSRAQSPGSINGTTGSFLNVVGSPLGSPQVSSQNYRNFHRPSSSSSSNQSYCETPSPANYQNPLDQQLEEKLGDHMMTRLPIWRESYESSDTLVNSVDSSELQLQLVEEVIRGDMKVQNKGQSSNDMQVVPNCRISPPPNTFNSIPMNNSLMMPPESFSPLDNSETTDDLTNTLLKFVGSEQAVQSRRNPETRSSSTSGYSSGSNSSEARKPQDSSCLQVNQSVTNNFLGVFKNPTRSQLPKKQTMYQQPCLNMKTSVNPEGLQFPAVPVDLIGRNSWKNYSESNSAMANLPSSNNFEDLHIPESVTSYNFQMSKSPSKTVNKSSCSSTERSIAPWPSLNMPSTRACERLKEVTDPLEVEKAMKSLLKRPIEQLAKPDNDGDTALMCLTGNPQELLKKLAYLAPLVERLGTYEGGLSVLNGRGEDALYLAAMNCPQMAFVTGYLAAAFLQKNIDIGQRLYRSRGDTLIHALAAKGDVHGEVLAELLSLKTAQGNSVFDLTKRNYDGRTPLHVAVEAHDSLGRNTKTVSIGIVRLLLENNADPTIREVRCGDTPLHLAVSLSCDPTLVKALLTGRGIEAVNSTNYNGNTPLHMIAAMSERTSLERQSEICWLLIHAGGRTNITNRQGKTALALVSSERKETLRRIFHKKT